MATCGLAAALALAVPLAAQGAGAIVVAGNGHSLSWTTHSSSPGVALGYAMNACLSSYGPGCRLLKTYRHGCMAISISGNGHWGWAVTQNENEAQMTAVGRCAQNGASCSVRDSVCE
jgi:hypothetical protein